MGNINIATHRRRPIRWTVFVALAAFMMLDTGLMARQRKRSHTARRTTTHRRRRRSRHYRRYLHVHIQRARVREIQEALVKAGFLHDKPDGIWGPATRDAMKHFQKQHGFTPTGLPEAKPLMLLGLGPHPLPPGLLPLPPTEHGAEAGSEDDTETSSASPAPTVKKPTSSN